MITRHGGTSTRHLGAKPLLFGLPSCQRELSDGVASKQLGGRATKVKYCLIRRRNQRFDLGELRFDVDTLRRGRAIALPPIAHDIAAVISGELN